MKTNLEKLDNNLFKLSIEIDADVAAQEYNKSCRYFGENITIPGFRKGKAPRPIIEKHIGLSRIKENTLDNLLPSMLADIISENQLDLVTEPVIESYEFELGKPVSVVAKLEVKPEVPLSKYKGKTIEVPEFKFEKDALDKQVEHLLSKFAKLEEVVGRVAEATDIVFIDFSGKIEGNPIKGGTAKNHQLDLANSQFIPGFAEQIVGKGIGEEFTIKVKFPDEYHEKNIAGKDAEFVIKINEIKQKILPELNDEFAQKLGPFATVEDLKNDLQKYLDKTVENENRIRSEKIIVEKVLEDTKFDPPDTMINREAKYLMEDMEKNMKQQGLAWEKVIQEQGYEQTWNTLREEAAKRVKTSLVLGAIAKTENIQLTEEDFAEKVSELAGAYNTDEKAIYDQMSKSPTVAQALSQQIMSQKIVSYLLDNNEVKYIEDTTVK